MTSEKDIRVLEQILREKREWSEERLCKVLRQRYDPGWERIQSLKALEAFELGEETAIWTAGLFFATLFDIEPEGLDGFFAELLRESLYSGASEQSQDAQVLEEMSHREIIELAEYVTVQSLDAPSAGALYTFLVRRAKESPALKAPTQAEDQSADGGYATRKPSVKKLDMTADLEIAIPTPSAPTEAQSDDATAHVSEATPEVPAAEDSSPKAATPSAFAGLFDLDVVSSSKESESSARVDVSVESEASGSQNIGTMGKDLAGADLEGANFEGADLKGADLTGANLQQAQLQGAQLQGASLRNANLTGANLAGADLTGASLRNANLTDANLENADLTDAIMREARLKGANLKGAIVR